MDSSVDISDIIGVGNHLRRLLTLSASICVSKFRAASRSVAKILSSQDLLMLAVVSHFPSKYYHTHEDENVEDEDDDEF